MIDRGEGDVGVEELPQCLDGGAALGRLDAAQAVQQVALPCLQVARAVAQRGGHIIGAADEQALADDLGEEAQHGETGSGLAIDIAGDRAGVHMQLGGGPGFFPARGGEQPQKFLIEFFHGDNLLGHLVA